MKVWRDVDSSKKRIGIMLWNTGGEIYLGHKLIRWRY